MAWQRGKTKRNLMLLLAHRSYLIQYVVVVTAIMVCHIDISVEIGVIILVLSLTLRQILPFIRSDELRWNLAIRLYVRLNEAFVLSVRTVLLCLPPVVIELPL